MKKPRLLFVDDEELVLDGLRRILRRERERWETDFANSGAGALELMSSGIYDVIVTDMRMPGMDGAELLSHVAKQSPDTVRMVLSGYTEKEAAIKCLGHAHQFLSKPCEADILKQAVEQALSLKERLANELLRRAVSQIGALPSLPHLYQEILQAVRSPDVGIRDVADIIAKDIGMSAKILQMVNSSFFGLSRQVSSVQQAASLLGIDHLKSIVLSAGVFQSLTLPRRFEGFSEDRFWEHCSDCGSLARQIIREEDGDPLTAEHALSAGMLHDVGKLVLATKFPDEFSSTLAMVQETGKLLHEAEAEQLGFSHADVGAYLLGLWHLPLSVVQAVAFHHTPQISGSRSLDPTVAVYAANIIIQENAATAASGNAAAPPFDQDFLSDLGLTDRVEHWRSLAAVPAC